MRKIRSLLLMLAMLIGAVAMMLNAGTARAYHVDPVLVLGNTNCQAQGYTFGYKPQPEPPPSGTYWFPGDDESLTISSNGTFFNWTSTLGIDAVIVKGGPNSNVYVYDPESFGDSGLHSPTNASGGYAGISHIEFCFDYELSVSKTAETSFTRTYRWTIDKSVSPATWDLFTGDSGTSDYSVVVDRTGSTDSDWAVSGEITVLNDTPYPATVTSVVDMIDDSIPVSLNCPQFPAALAPGAQLICTYSTGLPDGADRLNKATVTTSGSVGGGSATAAVTFGDPTSEVNATVTVSDTYAGDLGSASGYTEFTYDRTFSCDGDEGTHGNTATIVETGQSDSADVTVNCYSLGVRKTAATSFDRTWTWTIEKSADQSSLLLSVGQSFYVNYTIVVDAASSDGNYAVTGQISVHNPAPMAATINTVADVISGAGAATVDCGVAFPYSLAAGDTLHCSYSADLDDAESRTNTATAVLQNYAYASDGSGTPSGTSNFTGSAAVTFSDTPADEIDECITLSDTFAGGPNGAVVCAGDAPASFPYRREIGPYAACGEYTVNNTAAFVANDSGATDDDSATVLVTVPCNTGCTLTQGYWKTHSRYGPARYDDTWAQIGEDTPFYSSGKTYYQVLWTPPQGNVYYNLAHQYIAAKLNILNGAATTAQVNAAMAWAEWFFSTYTPTNHPKNQRNNALANATILDNFNNGVIGPGHCSE